MTHKIEVNIDKIISSYKVDHESVGFILRGQKTKSKKKSKRTREKKIVLYIGPIRRSSSVYNPSNDQQSVTGLNTS
jgi:hypothetical protein